VSGNDFILKTPNPLQIAKMPFVEEMLKSLFNNELNPQIANRTSDPFRPRLKRALSTAPAPTQFLIVVKIELLFVLVRLLM
jgi:hypothetical protein